MRCHDQGMKSFVDAVRPAVAKLPGSPGFDKRQVLLLYPEQPTMDRYLQEDTERFWAAMTTLMGKPPAGEPLIPVTRRFLDAPIALTNAGGELGLAEPGSLQALFRSPQFAGLGLVPLAPRASSAATRGKITTTRWSASSAWASPSCRSTA